MSGIPACSWWLSAELTAAGPVTPLLLSPQTPDLALGQRGVAVLRLSEDKDEGMVLSASGGRKE